MGLNEGHMYLPALPMGSERTRVPGSCASPTCRQKAHETTRLRAARCGALGSSAEFSSGSNRGLLCKWPVYRISIAETSCGAVDLLFQESLTDATNYFWNCFHDAIRTRTNPGLTYNDRPIQIPLPIALNVNSLGQVTGIYESSKLMPSINLIDTG
jgi:hypothetical protein